MIARIIAGVLYRAILEAEACRRLEFHSWHEVNSAYKALLRAQEDS